MKMHDLRVAGRAVTPVLAMLASAGLAAPEPPPTTPTLDLERILSLRSGTVVSIDLGAAAAPGQPLTVQVPLPDRQLTLDLRPHSIRAARFRLLHQAEGGDLVPVDPGPARTLRGTAREDHAVQAAGSLLDDGLHLRLRGAGPDDLWIQPLAPHVPGAGPDQYVLYRESDVIRPPATCGNDHAPMGAAGPATPGPGSPAAPPGGAAGDPPPGLECLFVTELAVDADFPYFEDWGPNTVPRIEAVIDLVNQQYETQAAIRHEIVAIVVRASEADDPYDPPDNDSGALLAQFRSHWLSEHADIERDVAHLFTGRNLQGSVIGQAWTIGGICTDDAFCHAQSDCCDPKLPCATDLTAHELGHLWDASHCACPDFTMNPSLTCANEFSPATVRSIVAHRDSRTCLDFGCAYPNDLCPDALIVPLGATPFSTLQASTDGFPDVLCDAAGGDGQVHADRWYLFVSPCDGVVTARLCDSDHDSRLAVYLASGIGCPAGPDTAIACADGGCGERPEVSWRAGELLFYFVRVGGRTAGAEGLGTLELSIDCGPPPCPTDIDGDGATDVDDLVAVILAWDSADPDADVNDDGVVDVDDLTAVILAWGACG